LKSENNAIEMATNMDIEFFTEAQYRKLQQPKKFEKELVLSLPIFAATQSS